MSTQDKITPGVAGSDGHNHSAQQNVHPNPDPVLDIANEHHHAHLHHGRATQEKDEQVMFATSTDKYAGAPGSNPDYKVRQTSSRDDEESGGVGDVRDEHDQAGAASPKKWSAKRVYTEYRAFFHLAIWSFWTAWWIVGLVYHRHDGLGWLKPTLLYLCITIRIITLWLPISLVMKPVKLVWRHTAFRVYELTPKKLHQPLAALITVAVFLIGAMVPEETGDNTRANRAVSMFGLVVMIALLTATSHDWRKIPWHTVIGGMATQFVIAVFVLRTQAGYDIFAFISFLARTLLGFAKDGVSFLTTQETADLTWFIITVLPAIIFFVALVSLLYYWGLVQWFIGKFATFFFWTLRVSGAEAVVAAATPFIGQGESAMLIRPFVPHLTRAEIHQVMCCGFSTIAGSVLVAYIGLGLNAQALVSSCIMSIPASLAVSKLRFPETEETLTSGRVVIPEDDEEHKSANALQAFADGAWLGIKIAGMIVSTLLCILGFIAMLDAFLGWFGKYFNIADPDLSLELMLGYILWPIAWLLGVPKQDVYRVAQLIGMKIIANEYVAFNALTTEDIYMEMGARSRLIATYACCVSGRMAQQGNDTGAD